MSQQGSISSFIVLQEQENEFWRHQRENADFLYLASELVQNSSPFTEGLKSLAATCATPLEKYMRLRENATAALARDHDLDKLHDIETLLKNSPDKFYLYKPLELNTIKRMYENDVDLRILLNDYCLHGVTVNSDHSDGLHKLHVKNQPYIRSLRSVFGGGKSWLVLDWVWHHAKEMGKQLRVHLDPSNLDMFKTYVVDPKVARHVNIEHELVAVPIFGTVTDILRRKKNVEYEYVDVYFAYSFGSVGRIASIMVPGDLLVLDESPKSHGKGSNIDKDSNANLITMVVRKTNKNVIYLTPLIVIVPMVDFYYFVIARNEDTRCTLVLRSIYDPDTESFYPNGILTFHIDASQQLLDDYEIFSGSIKEKMAIKQGLDRPERAEIVKNGKIFARALELLKVSNPRDYKYLTEVNKAGNYNAKRLIYYAASIPELGGIKDDDMWHVCDRGLWEVAHPESADMDDILEIPENNGVKDAWLRCINEFKALNKVFFDVLDDYAGKHDRSNSEIIKEELEKAIQGSKAKGSVTVGEGVRILLMAKKGIYLTLQQVEQLTLGLITENDAITFSNVHCNAIRARDRREIEENRIAEGMIAIFPVDIATRVIAARGVFSEAELSSELDQIMSTPLIAKLQPEPEQVDRDRLDAYLAAGYDICASEMLMFEHGDINGEQLIEISTKRKRSRAQIAWHEFLKKMNDQNENFTSQFMAWKSAKGEFHPIAWQSIEAWMTSTFKPVRDSILEEITLLVNEKKKAIISEAKPVPVKSLMATNPKSSVIVSGQLHETWMPDFTKYDRSDAALVERDVEIYRKSCNKVPFADIGAQCKPPIDDSVVSRVIKKIKNWIGDQFEDVVLNDLRVLWRKAADPDWLCEDVMRDIIRISGNSSMEDHPDIRVTLKSRHGSKKKVIFYNAKSYYPKGNPKSITIPVGKLGDDKNEMRAEIKAARDLREAEPATEIEVKCRLNEYKDGRIFEDLDVDWQKTDHEPLSVQLRGAKKRGRYQNMDQEFDDPEE